MSDAAFEPRAKRARVDKAGRFAALEKLKQLKGNKNKYEVDEEVDNVYEIVDEREYAKKAKEKYATGWIEEDGTGYAEDGRDFFEDEDDYSEDEAQTSNKQKQDKNKAVSKKRLRDNDKPAKGKASIRNLFSNAVPKKATTTSLAEDDVLADILGELKQESNETVTPSTTQSNMERVIAPAKIMQSAMKKKTDAAVAQDYMNSFINNIKMKPPPPKELDNSDDELLERILKPKPVETKKQENVKEVKVTEASEQKQKPDKKQVFNDTATQETECADFSDDEELDLSCLPAAEQQPETPTVAKNTENAKTIEEEQTKTPTTTKAATVEDDVQKLLHNWESICQMDDFAEEMQTANATNDSEKNGNGQKRPEILKFWYWEAWEDAVKRPGEVFLFGRTAEGQSICVRVENIDRVLYVLPREYLLDPITKEPTKQKVTIADLYAEFDKDISSALNLQGFRSRKVTKNFAHHSIGIDVPQICDYMEVHYDGRKPAPDVKKKFNSIAHIFGANSTALECFLLQRKIKGPCWLTVKQYKENTNTSLSWCKLDVSVSDPRHILVLEEPKPSPPPPLTLLTLNVRTALNPKTNKNEICLISLLVHNRYHIDKPAPQPPFNRHMCALTRPPLRAWPFDLNAKLAGFKATRLHKHDSERALLSWFLAQYQQIDADLIVTHDAMDCQLDVLADRIVEAKLPQWSRLGRLRMSQHHGKKLLDFYVGRMVCDVKRSAEECIRARSYDLQTLCQQVLKLKEHDRMDVNDEDLLEMYETGNGVLKLISLSMQDASFMLRLMYELNIMPLALQITNICGNIMTRTLQGGRSERNEFLLLHAFTEKNYIVPDKKKREWKEHDVDGGDVTTANATTSSGASRKKAAYAGGLVLEPIRGLYDKYILLMDFNSLYPSIIQEYNICFTTVQQPYSVDELPQLPEASTEAGILPQQLRRLVESRREVKKLLTTPDLSPELRLQYHIRQMALKLTANSIYGCLGFAQSRFFAQHLAALVTHKGREILLNTQAVVQKMNYQVVYGDTDSIMVNTNISDYEQVYKIGHSIKQTINKLYKQLELDIDGVFSVLLLLKKKKYAAVKVSKNSKGELVREEEHKGLDIVRRDWSQLAIMIGKLVLKEILSEQQLDEKLEAAHAHLERVRDQIQNDEVPTTMFVITKQLSKGPTEFSNAAAQPHVQVALRMNKTRNRRYKKGDMVDYVICDDGTSNPATQRAYHLDELKGNETLKLDKNYYLAHQLHPVVTRMLEVLDGTDATRIAESLGLDPSKYRAAVQRSHQERIETDAVGESLIKSTLQKYRQCEPFKFVCVACRTENTVATAYRPAANHKHEAVLQQCVNAQCATAPYQYLISIRNQLMLNMRKYIDRFYANWLICDDPACNLNTRHFTHVTTNGRPVCALCKNGTLVRQYTERDLYQQLSYYQFMFDLSKQQQKLLTLTPETEAAYQLLRETVDRQLARSAYCTVSLARLFAFLKTELPATQPADVGASKAVNQTINDTQVATSLPDA